MRYYLIIVSCLVFGSTVHQIINSSEKGCTTTTTTTTRVQKKRSIEDSAGTCENDHLKYTNKRKRDSKFVTPAAPRPSSRCNTNMDVDKVTVIKFHEMGSDGKNCSSSQSRDVSTSTYSMRSIFSALQSINSSALQSINREGKFLNNQSGKLEEKKQ